MFQFSGNSYSKASRFLKRRDTRDGKLGCLHPGVSLLAVLLWPPCFISLFSYVYRNSGAGHGPPLKSQHLKAEVRELRA